MKIPATKAGIAIEAVWCDSAEFRDIGFEAAVKGSDVPDVDLGSMDYKSNLEVWYRRDQPEPQREPTEALVRLTVELQPERQPSYVVKTAFIGRFSATPDAQIPLTVFATQMAVTYLVPFVRQRIAELTAASRYDAFLLPPLDVDDMVAGISARKEEVEASLRNADMPEPDGEPAVRR